ncbi:hypothetical protein EVAR_31110_1 [Eumeta japonica]|uniref:Uncharacterized protein n=1 Tax=Eumeta variegata TaxID=151549 RepID=A0A4C1VEZ4_EUMVA|nr:hypothetical protein EVAR_31110_1 [Eumeta japonica]
MQNFRRRQRSRDSGIEVSIYVSKRSSSSGHRRQCLRRRPASPRGPIATQKELFGFVSYLKHDIKRGFRTIKYRVKARQRNSRPVTATGRTWKWLFELIRYKSDRRAPVMLRVNRAFSADRRVMARWTSPSIDTRNSRGVTSLLPASWVGIGYQIDGECSNEQNDAFEPELNNEFSNSSEIKHGKRNKESSDGVLPFHHSTPSNNHLSIRYPISKRPATSVPHGVAQQSLLVLSLLKKIFEVWEDSRNAIRVFSDLSKAFQLYKSRNTDQEATSSWSYGPCTRPTGIIFD